MTQLDGRIAVVTGATRGIGRETARQLASKGATVYLTGRDASAATAAADELAADGDIRALAVGLDIADPVSVAAFGDAFSANHQHLDILINNAAAYVDWTETTSGADLDQSRRVFETNLFGTWAVIQAFLPLLRNSTSGRIVNVSSGAGSHGEPQFGLNARRGAAASYGISKAALNALTSSLAAELAGQNILVNSAGPGLTATFDGAEQMGARPVAEGAASIVWAATLDDDGPNGGFFRDGEPLPW
jgi:NAD(P)-dependent dehydrogenase (short-subunit alcohol dehydrogenase family)